MTKYINILYLIVGILTCSTLISCDKDPHDPDIELSGNIEKYFPSYCVNLSVSYSLSNRHFKMIAEPHFYFDPSEWGIAIEKIDYFVDDIYIKTETETPFSVEYESNDWSTGAHTIRADITLTGDNIETFVFQATKVIDNSSSQEKAVDVWFDYNFATTGEEFFISGNINYNRTSAGTNIKSFSAKWDDSSMGKKTTSPYKLTRIIKENVGTNHTINASIEITQGNSLATYQFIMPLYEIPGPNSIMQTFRIKSRYYDYRNGDILEGIARQFIGTEVKATYELELYLDNTLIGRSKTFPYELYHKLENLELGEHNIKKQWVRYDENGNKTSSFSTNEIITITN